jgi:hypothetical protein
MAKTRKLFLVLAGLTLALLGLTGCATDQKDSAIPWSRPAGWENQIPGMTR